MATRIETQGRAATLDAILERLRAPAAREADYDAVTQLFVDAMLDNDDETLDRGRRRLRRLQGSALVASEDEAEVHTGAARGEGERLGRIRGLIAMATAALERLTPSSVVREVAANSHAHRLLAELAQRPTMRSGDLAASLEVDATEISRTGGRLLSQGLVVRTKAGRHVYWELNTRGRSVLSRLSASTDTAPAASGAADALEIAAAEDAEAESGAWAYSDESSEDFVLETLRSTLDIEDSELRAVALSQLAPSLQSHDMVLEALRGAQSIDEAVPRARAVANVVHQLVRFEGAEAVSTVSELNDSDTQALTCAFVARGLGPRARTRAFDWLTEAETDVTS
jgi:DNA-binding MarR family transcriptional regulator